MIKWWDRGGEGASVSTVDAEEVGETARDGDGASDARARSPSCALAMALSIAASTWAAGRPYLSSLHRGTSQVGCPS